MFATTGKSQDFVADHTQSNTMSDSLEEARKAMIAKRFGGNAQGAATGGAGSVRRKTHGSIKAGGGAFRIFLC